MRVWEQRVRVFAPVWEWARLERVWCQVWASVFPARRWLRAQPSFQVRRWFPEQPLSFRGPWYGQAVARSRGPVRRARVFVPEQESAHRVPVFVVVRESARGALE